MSASRNRGSPELETDKGSQENNQLKKTVAMLARMIQAHDKILANLEQVNHDIETKINDLAAIHKDLFKSDRESTCSHSTVPPATDGCRTGTGHGSAQSRLAEILKQFERRGIARREKERYTLEVSMQNNPGGPYDDVFNNLAKIVEDIVKNMPESQHARVVGYTIITRQASSGDPEVFGAGIPDDDGEIPYELGGNRQRCLHHCRDAGGFPKMRPLLISK